MIYWVNIISIIIVIIFLMTATDKILKWHSHINTIRNYRVLKDNLIKPSALLMIIAEYFICLSLFFIGANFYNLFIFLSLIIIYTTAILINLYRGNVNISCGCGSFLESSSLNYRLVIRNSLLVVLFIFIFLNNEYKINHLTFSETSVLFVLSICLILLWSIIKEFLESQKILKKILKVFHLEVN